MRQLLLSFFGLMIAYGSFGQLQDHPANGETAVQIFVKAGKAYNEVKYPEAIETAIISVDVAISKSNFEAGGYNVSHRFPVLGDLAIPFLWNTFLAAVTEDLSKTTIGEVGSTTLSSLLLGWHNHTFSLVSTDRINLAGGFHWGDYTYWFTNYVAPERYFADSPLQFEGFRDPSGWYIVAGPAVMLDVGIIDNLLFHYEGSYGFSAKMADPPDYEDPPKNFPNPKFFNHQFLLRYGTWQAGLEHASALTLEEAGHRGKRTLFHLGFYF